MQARTVVLPHQALMPIPLRRPAFRTAE